MSPNDACALMLERSGRNRCELSRAMGHSDVWLQQALVRKGRDLDCGVRLYVAVARACGYEMTLYDPLEGTAVVIG